MQVHKFSLSNLIIKAFVFALCFYLIILCISILITGYIFINLDNYKSRIENVIFKYTGYKLHVASIKTKLNNYYLPEIIIKNATLVNPVNLKQTIMTRSLEFVFSYSSIWHLEPIFDQINIDGTDLELEYLSDGSIVLNGINLNHPDQKTLANTQNSPIDLENWILKQKTVKLSNINFSFNNKNNNFGAISLKNITTTLSNGYGERHSFTLSLDTAGEKGSSILTKLNWVGGKISDYDKWQSADLKLQSYTGANKITTTLKQYVPLIDILTEFNAKTALEAKLKNGKLQYAYANFDLKNLQYTIKHNGGFVKFPELTGNVRITLINNNSYELQASNLTISTPDGYLLDNKSIIGNYAIGKSGQISLENTNLKAINYILPIFSGTHGINLNGVIEIIKLNWRGNIFKPTDYKIFAKFRNISLASTKSNIPNINNVSGDISVARDHGSLNLLLNNSTFKYTPIFLIPYEFKHLDTKISWQQAKDKSNSDIWVVNLGDTRLQLADFSGSVSGQYIYTPGTTGYLSLKAHVDKILAAKVGNYLPKQISTSVHEWLNNSLIAGYGMNADLDLEGQLADFPWKQGHGRFYIDADIQNAKLLYTAGWPTLDNIYGKFKIRNAAIIVSATSAKVYKNDIRKALVTIPDMTADDVYLLADGEASGLTANFMQYLQKTPISELIGNLPNRLAAIGSGQVSLHLKIPFVNPKKTEVNGSYAFKNNSLKFDLPIPPLSNTTGKLYFTERGIKIDKIDLGTLNSTAKLSATTDTAGTMHFMLNAANLDYAALSTFYLPELSPLISGRANTQISFEIAKQTISLAAKSDLQGVSIAAPKPLYKESQSASPMRFTLLNAKSGFNLYFKYANWLNGRIALDEQGNLTKSSLNIGSVDYLSNTSNNPKILINSQLQDTYALDWLDTVNKITGSNSSGANVTAKANSLDSVAPKDKKNNIYPLELLLNTSHFYLGDTDYKTANLDVLVNKNNVIFALNNTRGNGYATFNIIKNDLSILFNDFNYYPAIIDRRDQQSLPFAVKINNILAADPKLKNITNIPQNLDKHNDNSKTQSESSAVTPNIKIPLTHISIDRFWFENQLVGKINATLRPHGQDLILESGTLQGQDSVISFNGVNYCMECGIGKSFVDMQAKLDITDLGKLLADIGYQDAIAGGTGVIDASIRWNNRLQDFDITHTVANITAEIKNGRFLKIDTSSSIIAQLIGIMNLQYLFSFISLNFGQTLQNGFLFNKLTMHADLINNKITIKDLHISAAAGSVSSSGVVDLDNQTINMHMSITPHLSTSVALGAGVATLNPLIGLITYGAEVLLGSPVNKLFTFSYHISGQLSNPSIQQVSLTQQVIKNVNSTITSH